MASKRSSSGSSCEETDCSLLIAALNVDVEYSGHCEMRLNSSRNVSGLVSPDLEKSGIPALINRGPHPGNHFL